jgi:tellurite resistance protein
MTAGLDHNIKMMEETKQTPSYAQVLYTFKRAQEEIVRLRARDETAEGVRLLAVADARSDALEEAALAVEGTGVAMGSAMAGIIRALKGGV